MVKMLSFGLISLILATSFANPIENVLVQEDITDDEYGGYRLPDTQIPSKYELDIVVLQESFDKNVFDGKVAITFNVTKEQDNILLHAPLTVANMSLQGNGAEIKITNYTNLNSSTDIRTIMLDNKLEPNITYILTINYSGDIEDTNMKGFYKSSYKNANNVTEYLLTTQFEPVWARKAFPCFDEPAYKAKFDLSITFPKEYNVMSNTLEKQNTALDNNLLRVKFKETHPMSTYLVAFVISKFNCTFGDDLEEGVTHDVCSRVESADTRGLAVEYGKKVINALEDFTQIKYNRLMPKMTQVAIPDFSAGAMENWGLVTYREIELLYDEKNSSNTFKQSIVSVIAHEFAHQWFGDLVTCDWWDDIFLNEGFATYFEFFLLSQVGLAEWEMDKQFVIRKLQTALVDDGSSFSKFLLSKAASQSEIWAKFNTIAYNKGACLIRMMENIMGTDNFKKGVKNYLTTNFFKKVTPNDLLTALNKTVPKENLPGRFTFFTVMNRWFNSSGYPVITVTQNGNNITIKQERFLYENSANISNNNVWLIPITYTLKSDQNKFKDLTPKKWVHVSQVTFNDVFTNERDWIILNNQESAYYRVQYSEDLWNKIVAQLQSNHSEIDVLNRAQIVDDVLNFARAGYGMTYPRALTLLEYLKNEIEYYPWMSAINSFNFLLKRAGENSKLGDLLKAKYLELLDKVYSSMVFDEQKKITHIESLKKDLIFNAVCKFGHESCSENAVRLFQGYKVNNTNVDATLRKVVYCNGLRYSTDPEQDWEFLWQKYQDTMLSTEQITILGALGCVKNVTLLKRYLEKSITKSGIRIQDFETLWSAVYSSSPEGIEAALEYLIENHQPIKDIYDDASSLLAEMAGYITTQSQIDQLKKFVQNKAIDISYNTAGEKAIKAAEANMKWLEKVNDDLTSYFSSHASPQIGYVSTVILVAVAVLNFVLF